MVRPTTAVYAITAARRRLRRSLLDLVGRRLDIKKSHTVICAALRVYTLVR
jgi:hypothetical protein